MRKKVICWKNNVFRSRLVFLVLIMIPSPIMAWMGGYKEVNCFAEGSIEYLPSACGGGEGGEGWKERGRRSLEGKGPENGGKPGPRTQRPEHPWQ